jgi:tetratricopeptide (TPR) repeat protein
VARFRREALAALQVKHDYLVHAYELGQHEKLHFLVMELVDGATLRRQLTQKGKLTPRETARVGYAVALALEHARQLGIVHRDVKPSNILIERRGRVKLADLGLAKFFGPTADDSPVARDMTSTGAFMGTVDYCAPEQAEDAKRADIRSDIYSLGCTLYECLVGHPPFPAGTDVQKIMAHHEQTPPAIRELNADVAWALSDLIMTKMLAKRPEQRFQTPAEAAEALRPWIKEAGEDAEVKQLMALLDGTAEAASDSAVRRIAAFQTPGVRVRRTPLDRLGALVGGGRVGVGLALALAAVLCVVVGSALWAVLSPGSADHGAVVPRPSSGTGQNAPPPPVTNGGGGTQPVPRPSGELSVLQGIALWIKPDLGFTTDAAGGVASWPCSSYGGDRCLQPDPALRPRLVPERLGGRAVVRFSGGQHLTIEKQVLSSQHHTLIAVVSDERIDDGMRTIFSNWASNPTSVFLGTVGQNPVRVRFTDHLGGLYDAGNRGVGAFANAGSHFILTAVNTPDAARVYHNRTLLAASKGTLPKLTLANEYVIGRQGQLNGEHWMGDLAELLVYDRVLSDAERSAVWDYLDEKYFSRTLPPAVEPSVAEDSGRWPAEAAAILRRDGQEAYRAYCTALFRQEAARAKGDLGRCNSLVWACCLGPQAVSDPREPLDLFEVAASGAPTAAGHDLLNTWGAALYRAGRFDEAAKKLTQAAAAPPPSDTAWDHVFLAMSEWQLNRRPEARSSLRLAYLQQAQSVSLYQNEDLGMLLREAERLVGPAALAGTSLNGRFYAVLGPTRRWQDARQRCEELGGSLLVTEAIGEALKLGEFLASAGDITQGITIWIGASDEGAEGNWRWITGAAVDRSFWWPGEPNGEAKENYAMVWKTEPNRSGMYDAPDDWRLFLCEWADRSRVPQSLLTADAAGAAVQDNPQNLVAYRGQNGKVLYFEVTGRNNGSLWGTNVYTDDSDLATASVHAGALQAGETGAVRVTILPGYKRYVGSTRNGVTSESWDNSNNDYGSFRVEKGRGA